MCITICKHCGKAFEADSYRYSCCEECKREVYNRKARRRYARRHPREVRHCKGCGAVLDVPQAERCKSCAEEWHRQQVRMRAAKKRADARVAREARKVSSMGDKREVKKVQVGRCRRKDANSAAMEKARLEASVAMLKEIYARRRKERRFYTGE